MSHEWLPHEEEYLRQLEASCTLLGNLYIKHFEVSREIAKYFKIPAIILGCISSAASFGTANFPREMQSYIPIMAGSSALLISILNTIESYHKITETMTNSHNTSAALLKLADDITCELSLPVMDRETAGIFFLRQIYTRYQQIINTAPPLQLTQELREQVKIDIKNKLGAAHEPTRPAVAFVT